MDSTNARTNSGLLFLGLHFYSNSWRKVGRIERWQMGILVCNTFQCYDHFGKNWFSNLLLYEHLWSIMSIYDWVIIFYLAHSTMCLFGNQISYCNESYSRIISWSIYACYECPNCSMESRTWKIIFIQHCFCRLVSN